MRTIYQNAVKVPSNAELTAILELVLSGYLKLPDEEIYKLSREFRDMITFAELSLEEKRRKIDDNKSLLTELKEKFNLA